MRSSTSPARRLRMHELQLLITDLPRPNGIAFSPDEKYLYVEQLRAEEDLDALPRESPTARSPIPNCSTTRLPIRASAAPTA